MTNPAPSIGTNDSAAGATQSAPASKVVPNAQLPNNYPRELNLDAATLDKLKAYLKFEIDTHYMERSLWVDDLIEWQKQYWAKPTSKQRTFPFKNAANIVIPLSAITVESVVAKEITTTFALDQLITCKLPDQFADLALPLERYISWDLERLKFRDKFTTLALERAKLGTCIAKSSWEKITRKAIREINGIEEEFDVVTRQGATIDSVPCANFLMPFASQDPQTSPWVGEEHTGTPYEVEIMVKSGIFKSDTYDKLKTWVETRPELSISGEKYTDETRKIQNQQLNWPKLLAWQELWLGFDIDGSGEKKEIVCHYHRLSHTLMSCRYNWYSDLHRPYRIARYMPVEHRWSGIGICKQNEQFQKEVTIQHRQRLDNATIANTRMLKVKKLAGYGPGEPVFPGKVWLVDDMDDIETFQLGEIYASAYNNEQQTLYYSQMRVGQNELNQGMPQVGTPGTATDTVARLKEGSHKYDFTYMQLREFGNELILDTVCNTMQFGHRDTRYFDFIPEGQVIRSLYNLPVDLVRSGIVLDIQIVGQNNNKILDRQNWTQISGMTQQYYQSMIQVAAMIPQATQMQNPLLMSILQMAMRGGTETFKQILEAFDIRNIDRLTLDKILNQNGPSQPNIPGTSSGPPGIIPPPGMGSSPSIAAPAPQGIAIPSSPVPQS